MFRYAVGSVNNAGAASHKSTYGNLWKYLNYSNVL